MLVREVGQAPQQAGLNASEQVEVCLWHSRRWSPAYCGRNLSVNSGGIDGSDAAVAIDGGGLVILRQKTFDRGVGAVAAQTAVLVPVRGIAEGTRADASKACSTVRTLTPRAHPLGQKAIRQIQCTVADQISAAETKSSGHKTIVSAGIVGSDSLAGEVLERSAVGHGRLGRDHANGSFKALPFDWRQRVARQLADGSVVRGCGTELLEETVVIMLGGDRQGALVFFLESSFITHSTGRRPALA